MGRAVLAATLCVWAGAAGAETIAAAVRDARFVEPVSRYGHAALGADAEWGALELDVDLCPVCYARVPQVRLIRLGDNLVFEDTAPRLVDLDADGNPEVIAIESDMDLGSRLAVFGPDGRITATPFVGERHRWIAYAGAADMDGDGTIEIAFVDRPHLARVLMIWRYHAGALDLVATVAGLTNHQFGSPTIAGGMRDCAGAVEVMTADAAWTRIIATRLQDGVAVTRDVGPYTGPDAMRQAMTC